MTIRFFLFPLVPVFWAIERALTPMELRIGLAGWFRLWLTGDCAVPKLSSMIGTFLPAHKAIADFHGHLDGCEQCRDHPHNLCPEGDRLIRACVVKPKNSPVSGIRFPHSI